MQLMSRLVHKAERDIDSLAAQLRSMSHPAGLQAAAAAAALSASSPVASGRGAVNDLIHAARSSVEQIAQPGDGTPPEALHASSSYCIPYSCPLLCMHHTWGPLCTCTRAQMCNISL